jgi:3-hydroxyethyl bacteriochlorophyllide a dehydrogenase
LETLAVVLNAPEQLALARLPLTPMAADECAVDIAWSGISTGTERLLWSGRMPHFPGMGYPLVPGYESVGRVTAAGPDSGRHEGEMVFVPGARCYGEVRGLFGGAASRVVACSRGSACWQAAPPWCGNAMPAAPPAPAITPS